MLYETRMLEREQAAANSARKVAYAEGRKDGVEQGKIDSAKVILENQMDNGSTLEQAIKFVKNLKIISDKELEEIATLYK